MTEEELDAAVDVIAAVDAGVLQSLNHESSRETNHKSVVGHNGVLRKGGRPVTSEPLNAGARVDLNNCVSEAVTLLRI